MLCDNSFIDKCKLINVIVLTMIRSICVNDIKLILNNVKRMKDKSRGVWVKNYNVEVSITSMKLMKASITNIKLMVVANLVCAMLMSISIIMFISNK
jgi:queuine/archaeosine tRNA-ribosyltransferase